ncbi:MAG: alpha/beta fold hydrolase [Oleiphilaceae bacterium]|nr:alpha/beta fold hydrolase [Oleiphilaceae bacterium]
MEWLTSPQNTAEQCGELLLYQQQAPTADGVRLAVWRCGLPVTRSTTRPPVVLLHGNYTNRRFWIARNGKGLAAYLYHAGYDVWIAETRGHGDSDGGPGQPHDGYRHWTIEDLVRHDIPAIAEAVAAGNGAPQHWLGHSFGGVYTVAALSLQFLDPVRVGSLIIAGSQVSEGQPWLTRPLLNAALRGLTRLLGRFPARALNLGNEDEPPGIANETLYWKRHRRWVSRRGTDYSRGLGKLDLPLLALAGSGDTMDPASGCEAFIRPIGSRQKKLWELGRAYGYERDYGHVDMIISPDSEREIWPRLEAWLRIVTASEAFTHYWHHCTDPGR